MPISKIKAGGINDDAVTTAKIVDGTVAAVDIADGAVTSAKLDTNIDIAGTLDVTSATTLDSTLAVVGNSTANSMNLGGRGFLSGAAQLGVNFTSATGVGLQINDTNSGNLGGMLQFYSGSGGGTLRANIQNANNTGVHMCLGTGGTVVFGNTGYTAANALDDYEEGTWTPTLLGDGSNPTVTYVKQEGYYTKIGNSISLFCRLQTSARSGGTGTALIGGLPYAHNAARAGGGVGYHSGITFASGKMQLGFSGDAGASTIRYVQSGPGLDASIINVTAIVGSGNHDILFTYTYQTNS